MPFAPAAINCDEKETCEVVKAPSPASEVCTALVPFSKAPRFGKSKTQAIVAELRKKFLGGLDDQPPAARMEALQARLVDLRKALEAARAEEEVASAEVGAARAGYREAKDRVEQAINEELEKARLHRAVEQQRKEADKAVEEKRAQLVEAHTKVAMLEVLKANQDMLRQMSEKREEALLVAKEAKRTLLEMKQKEKKAIEEAAREVLVPFAASRTKGRKRAKISGEAAEQPAEQAAEQAPGSAQDAEVAVEE